MEKVLQVKLLSMTQNAQELVYAAFRQCYYPGFVGDMWEKLVNGEISKCKQAELIEKILSSGHESPIEHVSFTFAVEGVSRVLSHQLVRHRISSFSQQSQRYCGAGENLEGFGYIIPPKIKKNPEASEVFVNMMQLLDSKYKEIELLLAKHGDQSSKEDARFILPGAAETKIVITMNCRSLWNFFDQRACLRAQWEIRELADEMLLICKQKLSSVFDPAGPKCERLGYCPEADQYTCGRYPTRSQTFR